MPPSTVREAIFANGCIKDYLLDRIDDIELQLLQLRWFGRLVRGPELRRARDRFLALTHLLDAERLMLERLVA